MKNDQFEILMMAITGLKSEMNSRFDQVDHRFDRVENRLASLEGETKAMRAKIASSHETAADLHIRVTKLESPSV